MNHDMLRRFAFIETRLLWGGGFTASELAEGFGIARQNAQHTIQVYQKLHPEQMQYERSQHRQVSKETFEAIYIRNDVARFLEYQRAVNHISQFHDEPGWSDLPFTDADSLVRPIYDHNALHLVLESLRQQAVVEIDYWSKNQARPRLISPHHLVFADARYHVRAYCHDTHEYRDFVLSRMMRAERTAVPWVSEQGDQEWHHRQDLAFKINPDLPRSAQAAIRLDFLSEEKEALLRMRGVRVALIRYVQRRICRNDWRFGIPMWVVSKSDDPSPLIAHP